MTSMLIDVSEEKSKSPRGAKTQTFKEEASRQTSAAEKASQEKDPAG